MNIEYRNASYRSGSYGSGKLIRRTEASLGGLRSMGANKSEAKAALLEAIERQADHVRDRRYLQGIEFGTNEPVTFVLYYVDGWCYDIVKGGRVSGSCSFEAANEREALEKVQHHFDQYVGNDLHELDFGHISEDQSPEAIAEQVEQVYQNQGGDRA